MALNKVTYTDDVTVIEAQNMNDIQDAVIDTVPKSTGGTFNGDITINDASSTTSSEVSMLMLGNSTATGTVGNSNGMIRMYGQGDKYVNLRPTTTSGTYTTANRTITLPDNDGTVMLNTGGTFTGNVSVNRSDGTTSSQGYSTIFLGNTIPTGTANNSMGQICLYSANSPYFANLHATGSLTANRQFAFPNASGTIQLVEDHTVADGSRVTTNVPNETTTTIATLSLGSGKWVIVSGFEFSSSFTQGTVAILLSGSSQLCTVRGTGVNGGGWNMTAIETVSSTTTISLQAYQGSGSAKTVKNIMLRAIKIA